MIVCEPHDNYNFAHNCMRLNACWLLNTRYRAFTAMVPLLLSLPSGALSPLQPLLFQLQKNNFLYFQVPSWATAPSATCT